MPTDRAATFSIELTRYLVPDAAVRHTDARLMVSAKQRDQHEVPRIITNQTLFEELRRIVRS